MLASASCRQQEEDRHAHRHAVGDLVEDDRVLAVGDLGRASRRRGSPGPGCA